MSLPVKGATATGPDRSFNQRLLILTVFLLLAAVAAYFRPFGRRSSDEANHSDFEQAPSALETRLSKTPAAGRTSLLLTLATDKNPATRYAAVDALGSHPGPGAADAIEAAFRDSSSVVRQRAMEVLTGVDRERGRRLLLAGLQDDDSWIRDAASNQIFSQVGRKGAHDGAWAVPGLIQALDDQDNSVAFSAMTSLRTITGKPWRWRLANQSTQKAPVVAQWKLWWRNEQPHWRGGIEGVKAIAPTRSSPAPDFQIQDISGDSISLSGEKGKVLLLNFWGTWCAPCQVEVPDLAKLDRDCRSRGLDIVGVALGERNGADGLAAWCKAHGLDYREALEQQDTLQAYGDIREVPVSIMIDRKGNLRYRWDGERDYGTFHAAADRLLREAP